MDVMGLRRSLLSMIGGKVKLIETGTYTPTEDVLVGSVDIPHSLGVVPDFIVVIADEFEAKAEYDKNYISVGMFAKSNLTVTNWQKPYGVQGGYTSNIGNTTGGSNAWAYTQSTFANSSTFKVPRYNSAHMLKGGVTYRYVIGTIE